MYFTDKIYNFLIHPQWDNIGSPTLYINILFAHYEKQFAVIELFGEWNDAIHNDIMYLKRDIIDLMIPQGITKFLLIGENVLNYHRSESDYYEEWYDDIKENGGWTFALGFLPHVIQEMRKGQIDYYFHLDEEHESFNWRNQNPYQLHKIIESFIPKSIE